LNLKCDILVSSLLLFTFNLYRYTLERVLEFLALELPVAFLNSESLDLRRLTESLLFVLGHTTAAGGCTG
jgi:hypothetical protein